MDIRTASYAVIVPIRLVLVDDHPIVLHGLQALFERQGDFEVVSTCTTGETALAAARTLHPDVMVIDVKLADGSGLDVVKAIAEQQLPCRAVLLTASIGEHEVLEALTNGVRGLVLKDSAPDSLLACVRRVFEGGQWLDQEVVTPAFRTLLKRQSGDGEGGDALTPRELQIVRMIAEGLRNKTIAQRIGISEGTVKVHLHNIYEKLGVDGRLVLLVAVRGRGLLRN